MSAHEVSVWKRLPEWAVFLIGFATMLGLVSIVGSEWPAGLRMALPIATAVAASSAYYRMITPTPDIPDELRRLEGQRVLIAVRSGRRDRFEVQHPAILEEVQAKRVRLRWRDDRQVPVVTEGGWVDVDRVISVRAESNDA